MSLTFVGAVPVPSRQSSGLVILVTGASRGIGLNLVQQYAAAHTDNVVIAAVRDPQGATSQALRQLSQSNRKVHIVQLDVGSEESIQASVSAVQKLTDHVDILLNNAGTLGEGDPSKVTAAEMARVFSVNVSGPLLTVQSYLPLLNKSKDAKVINVSSSLGSNKYAFVLGQPFISYGTSKAALNYVTTVLKGSFPKITFLSIHPGWVDTDMGREGGAGATPPTDVKDCAQAIRHYINEKHNANSGEYLDIMNGETIAY